MKFYTKFILYIMLVSVIVLATSTIINFTDANAIIIHCEYVTDAQLDEQTKNLPHSEECGSYIRGKQSIIEGKRHGADVKAFESFIRDLGANAYHADPETVCKEQEGIYVRAMLSREYVNSNK